MRFNVPQFIEVEDKIFGPLTLKKFIYLAGTGAFVFVFYSLLPLWLTIILGLPIAVFGLALAFIKINNQPLIKILQNALKYNSSAKLYLWKKREAPDKPQKEVFKTPSAPIAPKLTRRRLKDLAWSLDIKEKIK